MCGVTTVDLRSSRLLGGLGRESVAAFSFSPQNPATAGDHLSNFSKPPPFEVDGLMARLSGLQREVLSLYRKCLREVQKKPAVSGSSPASATSHAEHLAHELNSHSQETRGNFKTYARAEFRKHLSVNKKDFNAIEYLLRKGHRQVQGEGKDWKVRASSGGESSPRDYLSASPSSHRSSQIRRAASARDEDLPAHSIAYGAVLHHGSAIGF
ncbi:succinate dehydrogenase assembly factor 1 [Aspergillus affinis]|uniref:succinate dehydrogenase assembly factor 1 n=1 Tax=Aspergillus affinis TaxID=1070780 RepID=UPI0022FEC695|nr:complex 1 protein-domain-containing protein [Aspergillus affinis]KAI9039071.1 complex 1 protein-domain-containing protein [Aspergillus affinis]